MHNKGYVVTIVLLIDSTYVRSYIHLIIPCSYNYIFAKMQNSFKVFCKQFSILTRLFSCMGNIYHSFDILGKDEKNREPYRLEDQLYSY